MLVFVFLAVLFIPTMTFGATSAPSSLADSGKMEVIMAKAATDIDLERAMGAGSQLADKEADINEASKPSVLEKACYEAATRIINKTHDHDLSELENAMILLSSEHAERMFPEFVPYRVRKRMRLLPAEFNDIYLIIDGLTARTIGDALLKRPDRVDTVEEFQANCRAKENKLNVAKTLALAVLARLP